MCYDLRKVWICFGEEAEKDWRMRTVTQGIYCYSLITVLLWEYLPTCEKVHNNNFIVRTESIRFSYFQRIAQSESAFKSIFSAIIKLKNILHMSENVFILIDRQLNAKWWQKLGSTYINQLTVNKPTLLSFCVSYHSSVQHTLLNGHMWSIYWVRHFWFN